MNKIYPLIAAMLMTITLTAQVFNNAFKIQSSGSDRGSCITSDNAGNIVTAGYFGGSADFDPSSGSASLTPSGSFADIYLAKYDAMLNYTWAVKLGSSQSDIPYALATDASNNIIIGGDFEGTM